MSVIHLIEPTQNTAANGRYDNDDSQLSTTQDGPAAACTSGVKLSRRALLQWTGMSATALILATALAGQAQATTVEPTTDEEAVGILIDLTRCTGCQSCALACQLANDRPQRTTPPYRLQSDAYSFVDIRSSTTTTGAGEPIYVKRQCMHCLHPACVSACTVGALQKSAAGPVVYDAGKCIGCRYCQYACPFGVPTYDWENALGLIHKCQMCAVRQAQGQLPACIAACPNGALRFGKRHELLAQAHAQIASNPARYVDHVYGEHEAGGTSVLYLSAVPFATLGFPVLGPDPIPHYAETAMARTPLVALGVATVATVLHRLTQPPTHDPATLAHAENEATANGNEARASAGQQGREGGVQ